MKKAAILAGLISFCILIIPGRPTAAGVPTGMDPGRNAIVSPGSGESSECGKVAELLQQQKDLIVRETGQLKREIASLRAELQEPGFREIFAGIGYIFGLAGVGIYLSNRKVRQPRQ